jgi:hypothetical protein
VHTLAKELGYEDADIRDAFRKNPLGCIDEVRRQMEEREAGGGGGADYKRDPEYLKDPLGWIGQHPEVMGKKYAPRVDE